MPRSSLAQIPDLHEQPKAKAIAFSPLTKDELQQAEGISDLLGNVVPAYKSLVERLTALDEEIPPRVNLNLH